MERGLTAAQLVAFLEADTDLAPLASLIGSQVGQQRRATNVNHSGPRGCLPGFVPRPLDLVS